MGPKFNIRMRSSGLRRGIKRYDSRATPPSPPTAMAATATPEVDQSSETPFRILSSRATRDELAAKFQHLASIWHDEVGHLSNFGARVTHHAYLSIVGMGPVVVPLLLEDTFANRDAHWFSALNLITGAQPVPESAYGDVEAINAAWIRWGRENGYLLDK